MSLLDTASLIVTPNGYKEGKLYSVIPSDGSGDMSVTRATTATRVNSQGLVESMGNNIPRLDYSNGTCPSLLVEPQRTNVVLQSSSFDNAAWTAQNVSLTTNATTAPDGTTTAEKIILNNGSQSDPIVYQLLDFTINTRTLSFFAKASEYNIAFGRVGGASNAPIVLFSLTGSGSILHNQNVSAYSIEALANGWYRCSMTYTHGTAFAPNVGVCSPTYSVGISTVNSTGNGTSGIFIWGAQTELGSYATSYIPTTSASVTRNADVISKTGISSLIGQTEGTLFWDVDFKVVANNDAIFIKENATFDTFVFMQKESSGIIACGYYGSGALQARIESSPVSVGRYKIAFAYKNNDFVMYLNGTQVGTDTSGTVSGLMDYFDLHWTESGCNNAYASALWKTRLTNAQLATLTTI